MAPLGLALVASISVLGLVCTPSPGPSPPSTTPVATQSAPRAPLEAAAEPTPVAPGSPPAAPIECPDEGPRSQRGACLVRGLEPSSATWIVEPSPGEPFGYVCVYYGTRGGPRCADEMVAVVRRWQIADTSELCRRQLTLYFAPSEDPAALDALGPPREVPGRSFRVHVLPSDGSVFHFVRLADYVLEGVTCPDVAEADFATLVELATQIDARQTAREGLAP